MNISHEAGFQFLIGTLKTVPEGDTFSPAPPFQFLIGTLKTSEKGWVPTTRKGVSIPYRYSKNTQIPIRYSLLERRFQFLIGTLKTFVLFWQATIFLIAVSIPYRYSKNVYYYSDENVFFSLWFQFLIGTLKTFKFKTLDELTSEMFQFLIGTLKTQP